MKCPNCDSKLQKKFSFCPYCGNKFSLENIDSPSSTEKEEEIILSETDKNTLADNESLDSNVKENVDEDIVVNIDDEENDFLKEQKILRRKSLFYLFSVSIIFLFFTFCSVILMEHLNNLNKKIDDLSEFHYLNHNKNNSETSLNKHITDGSLFFEEEKVSTNGEELLVEFHLKKIGDLKYKGKPLSKFSNSDIHQFSYPIIEKLWFKHISDIHFEKYENIKISLFINGKFFSYIEK